MIGVSIMVLWEHEKGHLTQLGIRAPVSDEEGQDEVPGGRMATCAKAVSTLGFRKYSEIWILHKREAVLIAHAMELTHNSDHLLMSSL